MKKIFFILAMISICNLGCQGLVRLGSQEDPDAVKTKKLVPAEVDVSKFKKIAILDLDGKGGREIAELLESELQNVRVDERPFFEVINRSMMMKLLAEQRLSLSGFVDADTAAKIGKISGTQAIVTGRVPAFRINENRYVKRQERYEGNRRVYVNIPCRELNAYVDFNVSFMDSKTGQIIASTSAEGQVVGDSCKQVGGLLDVFFGTTKKETENFKAVNIDINEIPEKMHKEAAKMAIAQFVKKITPHYVVVPITILRGEPSGFIGAFKEKPAVEKLIDVYYDTGFKFAIRNQWDDAVKQWEKILEIDNQRPAAIYNIGIAFEMMGDVFLAEKQFKRSTEIRSDDLFFDALARVRKSMAERNKLAQQTGNLLSKSKSESPVASEQKMPVVQKQEQTEEQKDKINPPPNQTSANDSKPQIKVKGALVKIKSLPLARGKTLSTLKAGDQIEKLEEKGDWLKVKLVDSNGSETEGWVYKYDCEGYTKKQKNVK